MADALTAVMESNSVPELSNVRAIPTLPNDIVITLQENQPQNALAHIRLPPPPPPLLLPANQLQPHPMLQPQTTDNNDEIAPLSEEHIAQDSHKPPAGLNNTQQLVYRIFFRICGIRIKKKTKLASTI